MRGAPDQSWTDDTWRQVEEVEKHYRAYAARKQDTTGTDRTGQDMNIDQVFGSDSLKAHDLQGREVTVMVESMRVAKFDDGDKLELRFSGKDKGLLLNKTNTFAIRDHYGPETDSWIGKQIVLYPTTTMYQGRSYDVIRVKVVPGGQPKPAAPVTVPATARYEVGASPAVPPPSGLPGLPGPQDLDDDIPF